MGPIALLVQDDPWLSMPPESRLIARRERRQRLYGCLRELVPVEAVPAEPDPPRKLPSAKAPWFHVMEAESAHISVVEIIEACAKYYRVSVRDMKSDRRDMRIMRPRQVGYFLAKTLTKRSLVEIGRRFGGRDHTTALHAIRKIERLRQENTCLEMDLRIITASLGGSLDS